MELFALQGAGVAGCVDLLALLFGVGKVDNAFGDGGNQAAFLFLQLFDLGFERSDLALLSSILRLLRQ